MRYRTYTDERGFLWNPNDWTIERGNGSVAVLADNKVVWEFTDRGESDDDAIATAVVATVTESWLS